MLGDAEHRGSRDPARAEILPSQENVSPPRMSLVPASCGIDGEQTARAGGSSSCDPRKTPPALSLGIRQVQHSPNGLGFIRVLGEQLGLVPFPSGAGLVGVSVWGSCVRGDPGQLSWELLMAQLAWPCSSCSSPVPLQPLGTLGRLGRLGPATLHPERGIK